MQELSRLSAKIVLLKSGKVGKSARGTMRRVMGEDPREPMAPVRSRSPRRLPDLQSSDF